MPIFKEIIYHRSSGLFHQFADKTALYGLRFTAEEEAARFAVSFENVISTSRPPSSLIDVMLLDTLNTPATPALSVSSVAPNHPMPVSPTMVTTTNALHSASASQIDSLFTSSSPTPQRQVTFHLTCATMLTEIDSFYRGETALLALPGRPQKRPVFTLVPSPMRVAPRLHPNC